LGWCGVTGEQQAVAPWAGVGNRSAGSTESSVATDKAAAFGKAAAEGALAVATDKAAASVTGVCWSSISSSLVLGVMGEARNSASAAESTGVAGELGDKGGASAMGQGYRYAMAQG
jgi:hypothetical protein